MERNSQKSLTQGIDTSALKFKTKKITQTYNDLFKKAYCNVCFKFHDLKTERKNPITEKGMEMFLCYGCGVSVHHYCYGLETPYNEVITDKGDKIKMFACDRCRELGPEVNIECGICNQKNGALKKANNESFVHITCALFSDLFEIEDFETMTIRACPKSEKRVPKQHKNCDHCKKAGSIFKCDINNCDNFTHIYCAFINKIKFLAEDDESEKGWSIRLSKEGSIPKFSFDASDPKLRESLKNLYERVLEVSGKGSDHDEESMEVEEEAKTSKKKGGKKNEKKKGKSQSTSKTLNKRALSEEDEEFLNEVYDHTKKKLIAATKALTALTNKDSPIRGGSLKFECLPHHSNELYCICKLPYDNMRFMVGCDSCDNWFHCPCLGLSDEEAGKLGTYFCEKCKNWASLKQSVLETSNSQMEEESKCQTVDKVGVVPKDTLRFTMNDFLVLCIVLERQAIKRLGSNDDANTNLKALLDSAQYIPFNLNGFIGNILKKYCFAEALDEIVRNVLPEFQLHSQKEISDKENKSNEHELSKTTENLNILRTILNIYHEKNFPRTKLTEKIEDRIQTLDWLLSYHQVFSHPKSKPSLEKIQNLIKESQLLNIDQNLPELVHLRDIEAKFNSWIGLVEKVPLGKSSSFKDKIPIIENIHTQQVTLHKGMGILDQAVKSVIEIIQSRPNLAELKEIVTAGKAMEISLGNRLDNLTQKVKKIEDAHKKILKKVNNVQNLSNKLNEIDEIAISSSEILEIVNSIHKAKGVQFKLKCYSKFASNVTSRRKKSEDKMKIEDEEENGENSNESEETNSGEEIQETLKEADELGFDWGPEYKLVQDLSAQIAHFKEKAKEALTGVIDASELRALKKEAKMFNINFQEAGDIKNKIEMYGEIKGVLTKSSTPEQLSNILDNLQKNFQDKKLQSSLQTKLEKARQLEQKTNTLLSQTTFSKHDVNETAQSILNDLKTHKVELAFKNELQYLQKSLRWIEKLYAFYQKNVNLSAKSNMEEEKSSSAMEIEYPDTKNLKNVDVSKEPIEAMVKTCLLKDESIMQDIQKCFSVYKSIIKEGQNIPHLDERIKRVFNAHSIVYWKIEASPLFGKGGLKGEELYQLQNLAEEFKIDPNNEDYIRFKSIFEGHKKWVEEYKVLVKSEQFEKLLQDPTDDVLQDKLSNMIDEYNKLGVHLEQEFTVLKNAHASIEWSKRVKVLLDTIHSGQKISFDNLQELNNIATQIKIQPESPFYKEIKALYQNLKKLKDLYQEFHQAKVQTQEKIREFLHDTDRNHQRKELGELTRIKPTLTKAMQVEESVITSSLEIPHEELEELHSEILKIQTFAKQVKEFVDKYPINDNSDLSNDLINEITKSLNAIRSENTLLLLQSEEVEHSLHKFEWIFHAYLTINQKEPRSNSIETWKKLIKLAQKGKGNELIETNMYKEIQNQIGYYSILSPKITELKNQENALLTSLKSNRVDVSVARKGLKDEEAILKLLGEIEGCKVDMPEEKKYLEDLLAKGQKVLEAYRKITETEEKVPFDFAKSTLDQIHRLAIRYQNQERVLEGYMDKAKHLQYLVQESKANAKVSQKIDLKLAENINNQYKDCKIQLPDVAKLSKEYNDAISTLQSIEENLKDKMEIPFEDNLNLSRELEDLKINLGHRADEAKRKLWVAKVNSFKSFREGQATPNQPVSFTFFKSCLIEGYELLTTKEAIREAKEGVKYIESLIKEAEDHLVEIFNIRDISKLEEVDPIFFGFLDLREEIIDHKAQVTISKNYHANVEPAGRDLAKKDEQEIIRIVKNKEYLKRVPSKSLSKEYDPLQNKVLSPTSNLGKRRLANKADELISGKEFYEDKLLGKASSDAKKVKYDSLELNKKISSQLQTKTSPLKPEKVEEDTRGEAKVRLTIVLKANLHFPKVKDDFKNIVKTLEMNLFSDFHENKAKYNKKIQSLIDLFNKVKDYKLVSKKLFDKNFDFTFIQKLQNGNLDEFEKSFGENKGQVKNKATTPSEPKPYEFNITSLLSGGKTESPQESSKFKNILGTTTHQTKPKDQALYKKAAPSYLETLSDEEKQKSSTKPDSGSNGMAEEIGGYFSEEETQTNDTKNLYRIEEEIKPLSSTQNYSLDTPESGKKKELILYDPEMRIEEKQPVAYDPLKEYDPTATGSVSIPVPVQATRFEKGSILRIFKGRVKHNLINKDVFNSVRGCSFYTCEDCDEIRKFPKIPEDLKVAGKIHQSEALDYIQRLLTKQTRDPHKKQLIVGWVLAKKEYQESLQHLAKELLDVEKVGVAKYSDYASLYFLHPSSIKKDMIKNLDWKIRIPEGQPPAKASLLFVLYLRGTPIPGINIQMIEPEFIGIPQPEEPEVQSPNKMETEEQKIALSPITSDEGGEEQLTGEQLTGELFTDLIDLIEADPDLQTKKPEITPNENELPLEDINLDNIEVEEDPDKLNEINEADLPNIALELSGMLEEMTPTHAATTSGAMEIEPKESTVKKLDFDQENQIIVEKLQKMSKAELAEFIESASEEEKEKIISILNNYVDDDSKIEEEKKEENKPKGYSPFQQQVPYQQYQQFNYSSPMQNQSQFPPQMYQNPTQQFQQGGQQNMGMQSYPQQGYFGNQYGPNKGGNMSFSNTGNQGRNMNQSMHGMSPQGFSGGFNQQNRHDSHQQSPGMHNQYHQRGYMNRKSPYHGSGGSGQGRGSQGMNYHSPGGYMGYDSHSGNQDDNSNFRRFSRFSDQEGSGNQSGHGYDRHGGKQGQNKEQYSKEH